MLKRFLIIQKIVGGIFLLTLLVSAAQPVSNVRADSSVIDSGVSEYVPGELIVGFENGTGLHSAQRIMEGLTAMATRWNASVAEVAPDQTFALLRFKSDADLQAQMSAIASLPGVAYVERNGIVRADVDEGGLFNQNQNLIPQTENATVASGLYAPDDEWLGYQWYMDKIMYPLAPAPVATDVPCLVMIDSGIDYTHPDLAGKVFLGRDTYSGDDDPMDENGHGTQVAGVAAAITNNAVGIAGVSPLSNLLAVRVLGPTATGTFAQIAQGITWANNNAVASLCGGQEPKIYFIGFGSTTNSLAIANAIATAKTMGRLIIAGAGSSNTSTKFYPAADPNVLAVGATETNDRRTITSNYGTTTSPWVDIAAPGDQIMTTQRGGLYESKTGTVLSAAIVAGVAARVWAQYPTFTADQVRDRLISTGDPTVGFPAPLKRVNLLAALGGGNVKTIQGQIFDANTSTSLSGVTVVVKQNTTIYCTLTTPASGFYSCRVPAAGTYVVRVQKSGYISDYRSVAVKTRVFNANIAMSPTIGTSTSGAWSVVILWKGYQPFTSVGKEFDLWIVRTGGGKCYSTYYGPSANTQVIVGQDSYLKGQSENIRIYKAYNGVAQVWVSLTDSLNWPSSSRLTGSGLTVAIYKNNKRVALLTAPTTPTTTTADVWYVGDINTNTGVWTKRNLIRTHATDAACIKNP